MINKKLVSAVAALSIATGAFADSYAGAGLAYESFYEADSGVALVLNGGQTFDDVKVGPGKLAAEGEFTYSLVSPSYSYGSYAGRNYSLDFSVMSVTGYAAYIYDVTPEIYVKPRLGLTYRSYSVSGDNFGGYGFGDDGLGIALGVGGGYKLSETLDIYADLTMLDGSDLLHLTAGVEYHFGTSFIK